jgi:hypothetical protein
LGLCIRIQDDKNGPQKREKKTRLSCFEEQEVFCDGLVAFISVLKKLVVFSKSVSNCGFLRSLVISLVWINIRDPDLPESLDPD